MKARLEFNLPEDNTDFKLATQGKDWWYVCWQMDQWLRKEYKYMSDEEYCEVKYDCLNRARKKLNEFMIENGVSFDDIE